MPILGRVRSSALLGIDSIPVEVEVDVSAGLPGINVVGLPDAAVRESRDRIKAAIIHSGFQYPSRKITVNLAPADVRKEGSAFDLPIALALLEAAGQMKAEGLRHWTLMGELALDGRLRGVQGALSAAIAARESEAPALIVPHENAEEAAMVEGVKVYPAKTLLEVVDILENHREPYTMDREAFLKTHSHSEVDFADVKGQEQAKRALEIAAAGGHNLLMMGPPGSGKTMLARRLSTILPPMTLEEVVETTRIHSAAGLTCDGGVVAVRPFRAPHHTASDAGLIGGGAYPRPGEISLAHNGVLFMDELPEFKRPVLEALRQPLEDGMVTVSRVAGSAAFPARFIFVGAMNPTPHGEKEDLYSSPQAVRRYMGRVSGPLMDRMDLQIEVPKVSYQEMANLSAGESSEAIRRRVVSARERQLERFANKTGCNAHMSSRQIREFCVMDEAAILLLKNAMNRLGLSARAHDKILKVARTIADLEGKNQLTEEHVAEAIGYRQLDRSLG